MNIEIRKLTPDLVEDYMCFFDTTPHSDYEEPEGCYCVWYCSEPYSSDLGIADSLEKRKNYARHCVKNDLIQGYLAYSDGRVVGWCNANTKSDCLECFCWQRFMGEVPTDESKPGIKVKSVFCFAIAPKMRRKGIASMLLDRVCLDAANDGFDFVEAYPSKEFISTAKNYTGPYAMYKNKGFSEYFETDETLVLRKRLQ